MLIPHMRFLSAIRARTFRLLFSRRFAAFGRRSLILSPVAIENPDRIAIGDEVYIAAHSCLAVHEGGPNATAGAALDIGDGTKLGRFNHIYATQSVRLGKKVLTANGVYISDNLHGYRDTQTAVMDQPLTQLGEVKIGDHSWLGHNACIIGAKLGKHCIVGANSVVLSDAPDFSVLVGSPAKIIRRFDRASNTWQKTEPNGAFPTISES